MELLIVLLMIGVGYWAFGMATGLSNPFTYAYSKTTLDKTDSIELGSKPKVESTKKQVKAERKFTKTKLPLHIEGQPQEFVLFVESAKDGFVGTTITGKKFFIASEHFKQLADE